MATHPIVEYCRCGAEMRGAGLPGPVAQRLVLEWRAAHTGDGHGPSDYRRAYEARRLAEKRAARRERA